MTTLTVTRPILDAAPIRVLSAAGRFFATMVAARKAAADFEQLNNRTDAQLANDGLHRSDLARVVFQRHFA